MVYFNLKVFKPAEFDVHFRKNDNPNNTKIMFKLSYFKR